MVHLLKMGHSELLTCWLAAPDLQSSNALCLQAIGFMMEIRHYAPLIYADYCCFFSIGNIELFRAYQNFSCWENLHVHSPILPSPPPLPPFLDEVSSEEIVKKDN